MAWQISQNDGQRTATVKWLFRSPFEPTTVSSQFYYKKLFIENVHSKAASDLNLIKAAIEEIQKTTCVRFTARTNEANYIEILSKSGCSSSVGRVGGRQEVSLGNSAGATHCMVKGIIIHELLHALGFYHMHSSMDRDNYVKVNYENVIWGLSYAFSKYTSSNYGTAYDLGKN